MKDEIEIPILFKGCVKGSMTCKLSMHVQRARNIQNGLSKNLAMDVNLQESIRDALRRFSAGIGAGAGKDQSTNVDPQDSQKRMLLREEP